MSKWTLLTEWSIQRNEKGHKIPKEKSLTIIEQELILGTKSNLYPTIVNEESKFSGGYRLSGLDCEVSKLKP